MTGTDARPVLWQLEVSHYNEKVRWALDYKRIPHVRRALLPGLHTAVAQHLTGGECDTTPVLTIDGRSVGDSTAIIAELERRWPEPALYPADPEERRRALDLEEFFDEELGPHIRRATYHELLRNPEIVRPLFAHNQPLPTRALLRMTFPGMRMAMRRVFVITPEAAGASRAKMVAAMDRLEQELGGNEFLVGDRFSVADLTAAALFYPVVLPAEFPYPTPSEVPPEAAAFLGPLAARPGGQWVSRMYTRYRAVAADPPVASGIA